MTQLRNCNRVEMRRPTQAMTRRLLPVNNSAPATITRISPREKATPPKSRALAKPRAGSLTTSVKNIAPRPMNPPANTASAAIEGNGNCALVTPTSSTGSAISRGA
jgi:hypothetical protein